MLFYKKLGAYVSNFYTKRQGKQIYNNTTWYWCPIELVYQMMVEKSTKYANNSS